MFGEAEREELEFVEFEIEVLEAAALGASAIIDRLRIKLDSAK